VTVIKGALFVITLSFALVCVAAAQQTDSTRTATPDPSDVRSADSKERSKEDMGSAAEEMIRRAEIKHEEESHKEMLARADEAAQIGDELLSSYKKTSALSRDDLKKLDRLDKLVRKIRGSAGGTDDEDSLDNPPDQIGPAVKLLAETSGMLKTSVEKSSRLVISAAVIRHSNELIELIRRIRNIQQP
jgi:hypothetical protein